MFQNIYDSNEENSQIEGLCPNECDKFGLNHEYGISKEVVQFPFEKSCVFNSILASMVVHTFMPLAIA